MSYPAVHLNEECMREGMQIESVEISTEDKIRLLNSLSETGIKSIVVGSFVSPRYTPQMANMDAVVKGFTPRADVRYTALALNAKGRARAAEYMPPLSPDPHPPRTGAHLCDTFIRRNANIPQQREVDSWPAVVEAAVADGATEAGVMVGAAWGSNFTGERTNEDRLEMIRRQRAMWIEAGIPVTWVGLTDPMSWCLPHEVERTLESVIAEFPEVTTFFLHLHDARGMALPSIYAALRVLDDRHVLHLDVTAGGVGGCPYCGNGRATGMAATEDVVNMLEGMGIDTGVDLDRLLDAVWLLETIIGRPVPSHVGQAGPMPRTADQFYDPNLPLVETHDEARHFKSGPGVVEHQVRPWREPIPVPELQKLEAK